MDEITIGTEVVLKDGHICTVTRITDQGLAKIRMSPEYEIPGTHNAGHTHRVAPVETLIPLMCHA